MTNRKKKILFVQLFIFLLAISLLYFTYYNKQTDLKNTEKYIENKTNDGIDQSNSFENVEYKGVDLNGNRYVVRSKFADFDLEKPELINMEIMKTIFYFKDGTTLYVDGDTGTYNNKTKDMTFRKNIIAKYEDHILFSDNLDYLNSKDLLNIYGNVRTESIQGEIIADNLKIDLATQTLDVSMFDIKKEVTVNIRK